MSGRFTLDQENTKTALKMMSDVTAIFSVCQIKYTLTAGTLLGIIRENRLLPWDKDVDLRIFREDEQKIMAAIPKIKKAGYLVRVRHQEKEDNPLKLCEPRILKIYSKKFFFLKGNVMMDCFIATRFENSYIWSCGGIRKYTKKAVPAKYYDDLNTVQFDDKLYFIPSDHENYLTYRYGDWRVPQKKWRFTKDDGAIISTDHRRKKKKR